ncbi:hypothetical protein PYW07_003377 [Mythimna separata]|uniref:Uncharacterized protein n=1 Tax=Mythimna separata TaxID=271217 RepID=A0AAD7YJ30_MYTSE|nr:hypothetical protein PYW07_003377 [Mythimna separata]
MFSVRLIVVLFFFKHASCLKRQLCETDYECLMNAVIEHVYPRFVAGIPGVETSDPLHIDAIIADLPTIRYELFNATLTGLKNCEFIKLENKHVDRYTIFNYAISCPVLTLQGQYSLNGIIDSIPLEGKGECRITYEGYEISINGKREKVKDDKTGKDHINIMEYTVVPDLQKGTVKDSEYTNLDLSNDESCNRVKTIEEMTRDIVMNVFMNKFIQNLKKFQEHVPVEDLHFKYVG